MANDAKLFDVIGHLRSPYKEKFAIPRQPGLVTAAKGEIHLNGKVNDINAVRGLEYYSHLWLIFVFHGTEHQGWQPLVRPPRLGGNKKLGVLATRSTFRPNPIGMSVVQLDKVSQQNGQVIIEISGMDLLDNTPILDIKPYIPYCDTIATASSTIAPVAPESSVTVEFTQESDKQLASAVKQYPELKHLIIQVLSQDPRPAYKRQKLDDKIYGIRLYDFNIRWRMLSLEQIQVFALEREI